MDTHYINLKINPNGKMVEIRIAPTAGEIAIWRRIFEKAVSDPEFKIIVHSGVYCV